MIMDTMDNVKPTPGPKHNPLKNMNTTPGTKNKTLPIDISKKISIIIVGLFPIRPLILSTFVVNRPFLYRTINKQIHMAKIKILFVCFFIKATPLIPIVQL